MIGAREGRMYEKLRSPLVISPESGVQDLAELVERQPGVIEEKLLECGAVLLRGFAVKNVQHFDRFVSAVTRRRLDYRYGSTPRTSLGNGIFTTTEYPANQEIPLHNESSYQREWPLKIAFCCLTPADSGGETPIADMRQVTRAIGAELLHKFATLGVKYVRHYRPFVDVSWQKVFQTEDRTELARFCAMHDITHEWLDTDTLRTIQVCQGTACHPCTGEHMFFNQAHLFHVSSLGLKAEKSLIDFFGHDRLPRQAYYGDGEEIPAEDLSIVRAAFVAESITFPWQMGDVLLLDNMQFAHGRRPFRGVRKVIAALMDPYAEPPKGF